MTKSLKKMPSKKTAIDWANLKPMVVFVGLAFSFFGLMGIFAIALLWWNDLHQPDFSQVHRGNRVDGIISLFPIMCFITVYKTLKSNKVSHYQLGAALTGVNLALLMIIVSFIDNYFIAALIEIPYFIYTIIHIANAFREVKSKTDKFIVIPGLILVNGLFLWWLYLHYINNVTSLSSG